MVDRLPAQQSPAGDLLGAQKILERIEHSAATHDVLALDPATKARTVFTNDIARFKETCAALPPNQAAAEWLALYDRYWLLPSGGISDRYSSGRYGASGVLSLQSVIAALPPPSAWDALATRIESRTATNKNEQMRECALHLFGDYLIGSNEKLQRDLATLESQTSGLDRYQRENIMETERTLRMFIQRRQQDGSPASLVREFEKTLELQKSAAGRSVTVKIPDFVTLVGEERATELITAALKTPGVRIKGQGNQATLALARRICLARVNQLLEPQWALACSLDSVELYEAMIKKFPAKDRLSEPAEGSQFIENATDVNRNDSDSDKTSATGYYILGLLAKNRVQEAVAFVTTEQEANFSERIGQFVYLWSHGEDRVPPGAMLDFYERLLKKKGDNSLWPSYIGLALQLGKTNEMIQLLSAETSRTDLTFEQRVKAQEHLALGYLADDRVDEAVQAFRRILQMDSSKESAAVQTACETLRVSIGIRLATLGRLLKHPEWIEEGIRACEAAQARFRILSPGGGGYNSDYFRNQICEVLIQNRQYAKAESNLVDSIAEQLKSTTRTRGFSPPESFQSELMQLAGIYYQAGRYSDILVLLEQAPWWGGNDLVMIPSQRCGETVSLSVMAAEGLRAAGRTTQAVEVLKNTLYQNPGEDAAYQLLISLAPAGLAAWLDSIYQRDRFEERPLIWKAYLLMKDGNLNEAEKVAREALRVDPTDGETKAGDRVRGYAILADILEAKGQKDDAAFFRKVVESVRIAEQGDALTAAGLITQSLEQYEKAQSLFANAYCVQWRLAKRLDAIGDKEEAEKHYRIAFERMPEQFGQVASFCFGCEGAFQSGHSRSVAETVLLRLEKEGPKRPQVYYLLGQLRVAQERYPEAYTYYRKAVEMDPGYLDVWEQINAIADNLYLPPAERGEIRIQLLRMDPLQRHTYGNINEISDLKTLWAVLQDAQKLNVKSPESLLAFPATEARMKELHKGREVEAEEGWRYVVTYGRHEAPEPGQAIAENRVVEQILRVMELGARGDMENFSRLVE